MQASHGNLLHNEEMIRQAFGQGPDSVIVSWLPLYHNMGLIGGVLQPPYLGDSCVLMSPVAFLQQPARVGCRPFPATARPPAVRRIAYELCMRKVGEEQRQSST